MGDEPLVISDFEIDPVTNEASFKTVTKALPEDLSAAIGDAVHNIRSALDLMASELVRAATGSDKGVYFPFAPSRTALETQIKEKKFDRAGTDASVLLRRYAPYRGGNSVLRAIHDLDIIDKHKSLLPDAMWSANVIRITISEKDGIKVPIASIHPNAISSFRLVFATDGPLSGTEVVPMLREMLSLAAEILEAFAVIEPTSPN